MDSPFLGRDSELQRMRQLLGSAALRRGRLLLIRGEAGIGKSRLTEEFETLAATHGLVISRGHALDDPGMPVLWPWRQALGEIPGGPDLIDNVIDNRASAGAGNRVSIELTNSADAASARFRFFSRVAQLLAAGCGRHGRLLVLEDLHWGDELSCALLRHVVEALHGLPVIIVLTIRDPDSRPMAPHVEAMLADLIAMPATRVVRLGGLSTRHVQRWLSELDGISADVAHRVAAAITDDDGANPLHVRLVAEALSRRSAMAPGTELDVPDLQRLVAGQLAVLPDSVRRTVRAAAMFNDRIPVPVLAAVLERDHRTVRGDLDQALRAGIVRHAPGSDECTFVHLLVRDAVRADLGDDERAGLHHRTAVALAASDRAEKFAGVIARHWLLSGRPESDREALHWLRRAALAASAVQDLGAAVDAWGQALAAADRLDLPEVRGWLHIDRARARFCAGQITESLADCAAAVELARQVGHSEMAARAALVVAGTGGAGPSAMIESLCTDALALMPTPPVDRTHRLLTSRMLSRRAQAIAHRDLPRARELSAAALAMVEDGCADAVLDGLAGRHLALSTPGDLEERVRLAERAIAVGHQAHQPLGATWGHVWMFDAAMQRGDLHRADAEIASLQRVVDADGWPMARWHLLRERACRATLVGDFGTAEQHAAVAGELATDLGDPSIQHIHHAFTAELGIIRGTLDEDTMAEALDVFHHSAAPGPVAGLMIARLRLAAGDHDRARDAYRPWRETIMTVPAGPPDRPGAQRGLLWHAEITAGLGDLEAAERLYAMINADPGPYQGDGTGLLVTTGALARHAADLAFAVGRIDDAIALHYKGIQQNLQVGAAPYVALGRLGLAAALLAAEQRQQHDTDEARRHLEEAAATFQRLGMTGRLAEARRLQRTLAPQTVVLTRRETEIARLVAEAKSNREIADRLVVSERTVESHVRNALAKVGADTRTGLAAWFLRQNALPRR